MKLTKWWAWFFLTERAVGEKGATGGTGKVKTVFRRLVNHHRATRARVPSRP